MWAPITAALALVTQWRGMRPLLLMEKVIHEVLCSTCKQTSRCVLHIISIIYLKVVFDQQSMGGDEQARKKQKVEEEQEAEDMPSEEEELSQELADAEKEQDKLEQVCV